MVQTVVNAKQAFGIEGSIYDQSPVRAAAYIAGENGVVIGRICTHNASNAEVVDLGGAGSFAGVAINHLEYANASGLANSLNLAAGSQVTCCSFGHVVVRSETAFADGYDAIYNKTTGKISAVADASAEGAIPEGSALIPNAKFFRFSGSAGEMGVLELSK